MPWVRQRLPADPLLQDPFQSSQGFDRHLLQGRALRPRAKRWNGPYRCSRRLRCRQRWSHGRDFLPLNVSRVLWTFISPWDVARAAVIHDILYAAVREQINRDRITLDTVERLRAQADTVFIDGMKAADPNIPNWKISACYRSVRIFGRWGVRKKSSALVDTP